MDFTDYHAKYFAYELTKRHPSDSIKKLAGAVAGARVDLNPHQVDAALFAFNSPLSKGALITKIEGRLAQNTGVEALLTICWKLLEGVRKCG